MLWIPLVLLGIILLFLEVVFNHEWLRLIIILVSTIVLSFAMVGIDYAAKTTDTEVWSGSVIDWEHEEEWEEWIPPDEQCSTDSNGKKTCITIPGYYKHHYAENRIKTSDNGWMNVSKAPDGKKFDDNWPNDDKVLKEYWPEGTPTASKHSYVNKVNASYSIYRHEEIDLKEYPNLPNYPDKVSGLFDIDRIVGSVPNKKEANKVLAAQNTRLNKFIPDPEKPGKNRSWKQVNIIFVNVGADKSEDYGFALQDYWEGGNKNDFVISFSMNDDGTLNWVYPFSWSEVEILKIEVRDYMLDLEKIEDFVPVVNDVAKLVEDKFERKQFADFDYLQIDPSTWVYVVIWILCALAIALNVVFIVNDNSSSYRRYY